MSSSAEEPRKTTGNCGEGGSKILPCTGTAANCGGNALNLNRVESLQASLWALRTALPATAAWNGTITTSRTIGGGGYRISGTFGARYRTSLTQRFFLVPELLNIFPESKNSKSRALWRSERNDAPSRSWTSKVTPGRVLLTDFPAFIFRRGCPGGRVKSLRTVARDRVGATHAFPQNSENFFLTRSNADLATQERERCNR